MSDIVLEFDRVSAAYSGAIAALHGVSLTLRAGDFAALLGANGAGKTTLLKAASNLLPAERGRITGGQILYRGEDVTRASPDAHIRKGLVPVLEGRRLFRSLSIEENLLTGAHGKGLGRAATARGLEQVYALFPRLAQRRHAVAGLTSGGEQQMAAIGRGLMAVPEVFVLDEPSMGLAPLVVAEIFEALSRLNRETGLTILLAEQNSAIALSHAHHATVIENGRSVLAGPAAELRQRPDIQASYLGGQVAPA
ncbi:ATP-binding cassette domain-containing protein [Paracoccus limosus]|jgi:branched-chain amino acid transport system ATP-binding protein|uniref:ATP-binding cassette domain-containing protein n=1 Tax=Paracoccus limosus TaxID=913252 RepID=A0A844H7F3_9RHOB|nr:ABC transporter ATP-binding protein [Paracoccus limosus]MTH34417.1 ATP-binding cassette domain-containing protein [Paracoccus limosus]